MKQHISLFILILVLGCTGMQAQTRAIINGGSPIAFGTDGGIYFHNDTITVVGTETTASYALDQVENIVFDLRTNQGINETVTERGELNILPAPAHSTITLRGIGEQAREAFVFNMQGQLLIQQSVADESRIDISALPAGNYILRCGTQAAKFVKF